MTNNTHLTYSQDAVKIGFTGYGEAQTDFTDTTLTTTQQRDLIAGTANSRRANFSPSFADERQFIPVSASNVPQQDTTPIPVNMTGDDDSTSDKPTTKQVLGGIALCIGLIVIIKLLA